MKLHLPHFLRLILLAYLSFASSVHTIAQAETININASTTWKTGNAPGYSGKEGDHYVVNDAAWNIIDGAYTINSPEEPSVTLTYSSEFYNSGTLSVLGTSSVKVRYPMGIAVMADSHILNAGEILSQVTASGESSCPQAIYMVYSSLTNEGTLVGASTHTGAKGAIHTHGIELRYASTLTNRGTLSFIAQNTNPLVQKADNYFFADAIDYAYGIEMDCSSLINEQGKEITISAEGGYLVYGVKISNVENAAAASLNNRGNMSISAMSSFEDGHAYGLAVDSNQVDPSIITNTGNMEVYVSGKAPDAKGISLEDSRLTNDGTLTCIVSMHPNQQEESVVHGIRVHSTWWVTGELVNEIGKEIVVSAEGGKKTYGVAISSSSDYGSTLINHGNISITATATQESYGLSISQGSSATNSGSITARTSSLSGTAYGIQMEDSTMYNMGTLISDTIRNDSSSFYMLHGATLSALTEDAQVNISSENSQQGMLSLGGSLTDNKTISAVKTGSRITINSGLSIDNQNLSLVDDVTLFMGGDFNTGSNTTTAWNDHSLTIDNGEAVHVVTMGDKFSSSWNTAFSMTQEKENGDILLTQKEIGKNVILRNGSVKLSNGNLQASETLTVGGGSKDTALTSATDSLQLSGARGGSISNTTLLAENVNISGAEGKLMSLDGADVHIQDGVLNLSHTEVRGTSNIQLAEGASSYTAELNNVRFILNATNSTGSAQAPITLRTRVEKTPSSLFYINYDMLSGAKVSGSMTLDFSHWSTDIQNGQHDGIQLTLGNGMSFAMGAESVLATLDNGQSYFAASSVSDNTALFMFTDVYAAAAAAIAKDGKVIANTLWSSTSAVRAFARTATSQLSTPPHTMGDYTVWGSALGDYVSMSGFRSQAHGYAVGMDKQFCPHTRTGLAFGQMFGDFTADRGVAEVEQESIMVGLYSEYLREIDKDNSISFTSYIAYGQTENDADTRVGGSAEHPGSASWDDETFIMGSRLEWNIRMTEKTMLTPFIGLEYTYGSQESFTETFADDSRSYRDGSMQVWSMPIGIIARTEVALTDTQKLLPELTLAYVGDIARRNPHVRSRVYGIDSCHEGTNPGRSAFMMNVGTHWLIGDGWSAGAFYNLETRSKDVSQEASFSIRKCF